MAKWKFHDHEDEIRGLAMKGKNSEEIAQIIKDKYSLTTKIASIARMIRYHLRPGANKKGAKIDNQKWSEKDDSAYYEGNTREVVKTKERAIAISGADMTIWECDHWLWNAWGMTNKEGQYYTNYQVKVWFKKRTKEAQEYYDELTEYIKENTKPIVFKIKRSGTLDLDAIWAMSDFHLGLINKDNSIETFCERLNYMADYINRAGRMRNHIFLGGDLLESGAGTLMHSSQIFEVIPNMTGVSGIRAFYELFKIHFLERIKVPVTSILVVAGNHDRSAKNSKDASPFGSMAEVLYHFLNDNLPDEIDVRYDYDQLQVTIDGIDYILTHGDNNAAKNLAMMVQDYGDPFAEYHVLIKAHFHRRMTEKAMKKRTVMYQSMVAIQEENLKLRSIQLPPLCMANRWAKQGGKSSGCGFAHIERSEITNSIDHHDYALP